MVCPDCDRPRTKAANRKPAVVVATKPQASFDAAASIWAAFESYAHPTPLYYFRALAWHALRTTADRLAEPASAGLLYVCHQLELVGPEALTLFFQPASAGLPPPGYLRRTGRPIIADAV